METSTVRLDDVRVGMGGHTVLGPVSLCVGPGEHWALLGPNGAGKTTLLAVAGAWRHPSGGAAWVLGERLGRTDVRVLRARIGHVGHGVSDEVRAEMSALDVVLTGRASSLATWLIDIGPEDVVEADARLAQVGCEALRDRPLYRCSQGERQRVLLARALFGRPELLLFDEPAAGLDLPGRELLLSAMTGIQRAPDAPATIAATHHLEELPAATSHAALLRDGRLVASGPVVETLTDDLLTRTFGLDVRVTRDGGRWSARAR